jgi:uncharacterized Rmd1/YagE family protein
VTPNQIELRCIAYSTALSYPIKELARAFRASLRVTLFRDIIYVSSEHGKDHGAFVFPYGAVVMWGLSAEEEASILSTLQTYEEGRYENPEKDLLMYSYGEENSVVDDSIVLASTDLDLKLAFSHGIAQSVKLSVFEAIVRKTIETTRTIPEHLSKYGRVPLSRKEIRRKMGDLFMERSSINLHFDVLDLPEFFWDHSELEPVYILISNYLDLESRVEVLNQRLDVVHDLFEVLGNELNHQYSARLEWIVIILIVSEVMISLLREFRIIG